MESKRLLIVNADDFGIDEAVNEGVIKGHREGCVTSASLMAGGAAFEQAAELARNNPKLGIGVHLALVGIKPLTDAHSVATLTNAQGDFYGGYPEFIKNYMLGKIKIRDIYRELRAQIKKVFESGLSVTHLDSHQHLHVLPGLTEIVINLALEFKIKAVRIPCEPLCFFGGYKFDLNRLIGRSALTILAACARRKIQRAGMVAPDNFFGMLAGGNLREEFFLNIIDGLPLGASEIMIHPGIDDAILNAKYGWQYNWRAELEAVTSLKVREKISGKKIRLISFRDIINHIYGRRV